MINVKMLADKSQGDREMCDNKGRFCVRFHLIVEYGEVSNKMSQRRIFHPEGRNLEASALLGN